MIYGNEKWIKTTNELDVARLAKNVAKTGSSRYFITLMQGRKYMLAPNAVYDEIAGTKPGEACAIRDIPLELGTELAKYGIDLYLYYTGDGPHMDKEIGGRFGFTEPRQNVSMEFARRWAAVLWEYSTRKVGCALTIDVMLYPDGTFDAAQMNELVKLSDMLERVD